MMHWKKWSETMSFCQEKVINTSCGSRVLTVTLHSRKTNEQYVYYQYHTKSITYEYIIKTVFQENE